MVPSLPRPVVLRPRLFDVLDRGTQGGLTLVSAPAGAGKTALLSSWLAERPPQEVAWLSPRPGCGEAQFWSGWVSALAQVAPAGSLLSRLTPPRVGTPPRFVVQLLNGFSELERPLVVVVDDLHAVHGQGVFGGLEELLHAAPAGLRLVVSTRRDPLLRLHVLRASGELTELRARDLALTAEETQELLDAMGVELDQEEFKLMFRRTEGWPAGVRLFILPRTAPGKSRVDVATLALDERPAAEYLTAEVLASQSDDAREFLLRTSIVDRITPELADALTDRDDSIHVLDRLVADNLFIDRSPGGPWYRYHHLFCELLRSELRLTSRSEVPRLHARAARWHLERGVSLEAVQHALAAGDVELVRDCLVASWFDLFTRTDAALRRDLLTGISEAEIESSRELSAVAASIDLLGGKSSRAARRLKRSRRSPRAGEPVAQAVITFAEVLRRLLEGDASGAARHAERLYELAVTEPLPADSNDTVRAVALGHLGTAELLLERYDAAQAHLDEALQLARVGEIPYVEVGSIASLAWLELMLGRLRRAGRLARRAIELAETIGWDRSFQTTLAYAALAAAEFEWDDLDAARAHAHTLGEVARAAEDSVGRAWSAVIESALQHASQGDAKELALQRLRGGRADVAAVDSPSVTRAATLLEARLLVAAGDWGAAESCVAELAAEEPRSTGVLAARARLRLLAGEPQDALALVSEDPVDTNAAAVVEYLALRALAQQAIGNRQAAFSSLDEALGQAEPEAIRRPLVAAGVPMRGLLADYLRNGGTRRWFASELLRSLDGRREDRSAPLELLEPLSSRELEVLHYLPTMMSNADIANELFVSVNTVKTHVKSIYRKLEASSRQEAVRNARQLHLL
jgi:LuxR family maltose regulon positive regulatory protein